MKAFLQSVADWWRYDTGAPRLFAFAVLVLAIAGTVATCSAVP